MSVETVESLTPMSPVQQLRDRYAHCQTVDNKDYAIGTHSRSLKKRDNDICIFEQEPHFARYLLFLLYINYVTSLEVDITSNIKSFFTSRVKKMLLFKFLHIYINFVDDDMCFFTRYLITAQFSNFSIF